MSSDPKKPLDPSPSETPDLLQKELNLDRRQRVPSFEELTHAAPPPRPDTRTLPGGPGPFNANSNAPTSRTTVAPVGTVTPGNPVRQPTNFELATTAQHPHHRPMGMAPSPVPQRAPEPARMPVAAAPSGQPRVQIAAPTQAPPQPMSPSGRHPPPNVGAPSAPVKRTAPPSPNEWATARALELPTMQVPKISVPVPHAPLSHAQPTVTHAAPTQARPPAAAPAAQAPVTHAPTVSARPPAELHARGAVPQVPAARPPPATPVPEPVRASKPHEGLITAPQRPIVHLPAEDEPLDGPAQPMNLSATQPAVKNPYAPPRRDTPKADTLQAPSEPVVPPTRKLEAVTATRPEPAVISTRLEPAVSLKPHAESHDVNAAPASLWRRTFAWILDLAVISLVVGGFFGAALAVIGKPSLALLTSVAVPALGVVGFVAFVYTTLFAFLWKGRTPGRRLLGIQLVDSTGQAPGAVRALIRAGLSLASFGLFLSGFWLALFDRKGQTLHDKLTSTFVVRLRPAA